MIVSLGPNSHAAALMLFSATALAASRSILLMLKFLTVIGFGKVCIPHHFSRPMVRSNGSHSPNVYIYIYIYIYIYYAFFVQGR